MMEGYNTFFGLDSRILVWIVAQVHLLFAAFVLAVPVFAVSVEYIGTKTGDKRMDDLAHEFTKLLSSAFSMTAATGGILGFSLFCLYPDFMKYMTNVFSEGMFIYTLLFIGEGFCLYFYYYSWDRLQDNKALHIGVGCLLNLFGVALMMIGNSWATFMMSPSGVDMETGEFIGTIWQATHNLLWNPLNIHRFIANIVLGGFVVGAYAAVKFMGCKTDEERAHYDWMGYIGNFIGIGAMIPLPFAGYFLGREVYSASAVMGNIMMGGRFSWTFIVQAILIGIMFLAANYYLWAGMERIKGSDRYTWYIKYLNGIIMFCFAVWLTPHNLPLTGEERSLIGEQYHIISKYFGVMAAKNAVVNLMIVTTFFSFLLYRRSNKFKTVPVSQQPGSGKYISIFIAMAITLFMTVGYGFSVMGADVDPEVRKYLSPISICLFIQAACIIGAVVLTFANRGLLGQWLIFASTIIMVVMFMWYWGFVLMKNANLGLRYLSVSQVVMLITCLIMNAVIDAIYFSKAETSEIQWGRMHKRSQFALILLCVIMIMTMGLMGYVRSGLREGWHVYAVVKDTSPWAFTPTLFNMTWVVGLIMVIFFALISMVFWLSSLTGKKKDSGSDKEVAVGH
ncbi:MAG: cytochrome ubiquinol oxidase subunit I [Candidatus Anammoxibacter sp.]